LGSPSWEKKHKGKSGRRGHKKKREKISLCEGAEIRGSLNIHYRKDKMVVL